MSRKEIARAVEMAREFHAEHGAKWPFDDRAATEFLSGLPYLTVTDGGFFAGSIYRHPMSPDWLVAAEIFMWAKDGTGLKQARAFRAWAKGQGVQEIQWSCHPENRRVRRVYDRSAEPDQITYSEVL